MLLGRLPRHVVDDDIGLRAGRVAADERCGDRDRRAVEVARELLRRRGLHRLEHVQSGGEHFVLDLDRAHRHVTDVLAIGRDDGDRCADLEDLLVEEEAGRERGAEEDVLVFLRQVPAVKDLADAGDLLRLRRVDRLDLRVRVAAAQRTHEEHAGHAQVLGVRPGVRDDAVALDAGDVRADHLEGTEDRDLGRRGALAAAGELVAVLRDHAGDHLRLLGDHLLPGGVLCECVPVLVAQARGVRRILDDTYGFDLCHL